MGVLLLFKNKQISVQAGILDLFSLSQGGISATAFADETNVEIAEIFVDSLNPTAEQSAGPGIIDILSLTQGGWAVPSSESVSTIPFVEISVQGLSPTAVSDRRGASLGGASFPFVVENYIKINEDHQSLVGICDVVVSSFAPVVVVSENIVSVFEDGGTSRMLAFAPRSTVTENKSSDVSCYRLGIFTESICARQEYYTLSEEEIILLLAA